MKYQLINTINPNYSALEQVLTNRGIKYENILHYVNTTDEDINSFLLLGEKKLKQAVICILEAVRENKDIIIVVDSDCDGFTSSSLLINYLYDLFPAWVVTHVHWIIHSGKQHGLSDCCDEIIKNQYSLVIVPDAGSNDYEYQDKLFETGVKTIVLDHHEIEEPEKIKNAIVINNQWENYPNKQLSGVGVVWQFCRYIDSLMGSDNANNYLDLVALGNTADMMSLTSLETKHLINKGFEPNNIHNPFIHSIWQKNQFKLGEHITSWGAAFYIAPFVNAMVRSGTQEEKELLFESMLKMRAFEMVPSTKRGCKGQEEQIVEQAIRTCTNVKNRQTRAQDAGLEFLENMIQEQNLLDNKVILFLLKPGQVDRNIAGLIANKFMAKYQRPCCILTRVEEENQVSYQGSARGCDKVGVTEFKDICAETGVVMYTIGHQGAFGLGIEEHNIQTFIDATNEMLKDMSEEPLYYVDYIYDGGNVDPQNILDIADMDSYWGKDIDESLIAIKGLKVTKDMVTLMSPDKTPTLKIVLPNKVSIIKFGSSQEEYEKLATDGYIEMDIIGKCNKNVWNGWVNAQIMLESYEIIDSSKYYF
jgi:single-stranded-DNA-specific exonuclease